MPPLIITYKDGEFRVSDGRSDQTLKDFLKTVNHCEICNAIIPEGRERCDICRESFPCDKCENKVTDNCMCSKWRRWFELQWSQFCQKTEN